MVSLFTVQTVISICCFNTEIFPVAAMECLKNCCKNFIKRKGKEQETQGKLASCTAAHQTASTVFISDCVIFFDFKWSHWRCLLTKQQSQDGIQMKGGGGSQRTTSSPSCPRMAETCRLFCRPSRPPTSSPEAPATPIYSPGCRVRTYWTITSAIN